MLTRPTRTEPPDKTCPVPPGLYREALVIDPRSGRKPRRVQIADAEAYLVLQIFFVLLLALIDLALRAAGVL